MATFETPTEVRAEARYVRTAPRKAQLVAEQIRGRTVPEARTILTFMTRDAARDVARVLESAVANAEANHGLTGDELYVSAAYVGSGPTLKRWRARARGRVARIKKRTCHITVRLAAPDGVVAAPSAPTAAAAPAPKAEPESPAVEAAPKRAPRKPAAETKETKPKREAKPEADASEKKPKRTPRKKKDEEA